MCFGMGIKMNSIFTHSASSINNCAKCCVDHGYEPMFSSSCFFSPLSVVVLKLVLGVLRLPILFFYLFFKQLKPKSKSRPGSSLQLQPNRKSLLASNPILYQFQFFILKIILMFNFLFSIFLFRTPTQVRHDLGLGKKIRCKFFLNNKFWSQHQEFICYV